jgi:hypothetical protein
MRPLFAATLAASLVASWSLVPRVSQAQGWNDERTQRLIDRAITRRAAQLADTGLTDYRALAHGTLTFLAQMGEGFPDPPKVVRTDELAVEVYWRAPNLSKQVIVGRRDTLLLPTDIEYHRDHLAIVQNNFPAIIRLGDGDEVRDVPHPLSALGRDAYDFQLADSLTIRTTDQTFDVVMIRVRPRDDRQPRAVGAVYLDRATGVVVQMSLSFTRAALKDPELEDVSIVLQNGLVDGHFWLPRRQEIEIRRTGSWMDFPARGIIRGRWEIGEVRPNVALASPLFTGPEIVAVPLAQQRAYPFRGDILQALPSEVRLSTDDDVARIQEEARTLVRAEALARTRLTSPSARGVSDLVRFDRNEGLAVGGGVARRFGAGIVAAGALRYGFGDHRVKPTFSLGVQRATGMDVSLQWRDEFAFAGDAAEVSGVRNSIAAQEFGSDLTDAYRARGTTVRLGGLPLYGARWSVAVTAERQEPLAVRARPATGAFAPAFDAAAVSAWRAALGVTLPRATSAGRWQGGGTLTLQRLAFDDAIPGRAWSTMGRAAGWMEFEQALSDGTLVWRGDAAGAVGPRIPAQSLALAGGPVTAAGYDFHRFASRAVVAQRLEWRHTVGDVPVRLGRYGALGMGVRAAPFDLLRFDVARGLRGGRWTFGVDISRDLWRVL